MLSAGYYDAYYLKAQRVRSLILADFNVAFEDVDLVLTPTAPSDAFAIGEKEDDPIAMYMNDVFTVPASLAGLPAISVPSGLSGDGLPLGLHAYYLKAQRVRSLILADFNAAFEDVDLVLTPTAPSDAFAIGEKEDDPIAMYMNDVFTVPASLAGLPAISVPSGLSGDGLPLGLHLIGRPFDEATVLRAAEVLERAAAFDARPQFVAGA